AGIATGAAAGPAAVTQPQQRQHQQSPTTAPAAVTTAPSPDRKQFIGRLPNGVWVEILGVTNEPFDGHAWWQADGSPLPGPPLPKFFDKPIPQMQPDAKERFRQIALRWHRPADVGMAGGPSGGMGQAWNSDVEDPNDHSRTAESVEAFI